MSVEERAQRKAAAKRKREENKFRNSAKEIFSKSGFNYIKSENKEFTFKAKAGGTRTTELDGVFVYENILIILEDTCSNNPSEHLAKKQLIFDLALKNKNDFIKCLLENLPDFNSYYKSKQYGEDDYILKILYFSMHSVDTQYIESAARVGVQVVERALTNYFHALVKSIHASAKYEILKFLNIPYSEVGSAKVSGGNSENVSTYKGFLLPEANSSYPKGYKVVSFYADPESLLKKSYVLRKNSWLDPDLSYQRVLDISKIKLMRKYLSENKRVYLGNIIATLPSTTKFLDVDKSDQLSEDDLKNIKPVKILLPDEYNVVGLIDGQHRVYSYHEGIDSFETDISRLRNKQNLLVTAIIYPEDVTEDNRILFEAQLFLEINSRQTKVKSVLTQEIELLVNPYSTTAIAKSILIKLARKGALKDKLEEHIFDDEKKLKISSIISYGLKPLVKKEGADSLFNAWREESKKEEILSENNKAALDDYIEFCVTEINALLNSVKASNPNCWKIGDESKFLTPTSINGFLKCLRLILEKNNARGFEDYRSRLVDISQFDFNAYKSSNWNQLGTDLHSRYFADA